MHIYRSFQGLTASVFSWSFACLHGYVESQVVPKYQALYHKAAKY